MNYYRGCVRCLLAFYIIWFTFIFIRLLFNITGFIWIGTFHQQIDWAAMLISIFITCSLEGDEKIVDWICGEEEKCMYKI